MHQPDVCIVGAGIIGLSLALELDRSGVRVTVLERDTPMTHASQAAAGMLAAHDPENPPDLLPLAELSLRLYPAFLDRIENLSGQRVPFQTGATYQSISGALATSTVLPPDVTPGGYRFAMLEEHSLDPRQLAPALLSAVRGTTIRILSHTALHTVTTAGIDTLHLETTSGRLATTRLVHTQGAWSPSPISPRKGQMLAVRVPPGLALDYVVRTRAIYIVPRTVGPRAGQAIIGATVEDAGFDIQTDQAALNHLRALAAILMPALAEAPAVDQWAGLRPCAPNHLPLLGQLTHNQFLATGHYRNGILLAPATAHVMAQTLLGDPPTIDLSAFAGPFAPPPRQTPSATDIRPSPMTNL